MKCTCGHIVCVCHILETHVESCKYRTATTGVAIECEHGYNVCPKCDPCTCSTLKVSTQAVELTKEIGDYSWPSSGV
jgi:hypothetical protein